MIRHRYETTRSTFARSGNRDSDGLSLRPPGVADRAGLAELMMSAYVGTIDYDGETYDDAITEVDGWFAGEAYPATSLIATDGEQIVAAVLNSLAEGDPLVAYVMTRAGHKGRGIARSLLDRSVQGILTDGHDRVAAWITNGNLPSERLFTRAGFVVVETLEPDPH